MTTLTNNSFATIAPPATPLAPPAQSQTLTLTIRQAGMPDRTVDLPSGKCTVGSSQSCQIRLPSSSVRPLHCLIVHDLGETVVTRWAAGALLNGSDFSSAAFQPGDCLTLGEFEIQRLASSSASDAPMPDVCKPPVQPAQSSAVAEPVQDVTGIQENLSELAALERAVNPSDSKASVEKYRSANNIARRRCRELVSGLRTVKTESAQLGNHVEQLQGDLETAQQHLHCEQSKLQESHDQYGQLQSELAALEQERDLFLQEKTEDVSRFGLLEQTVTEREDRIDAYKNELQQAGDSLELAYRQNEEQRNEYQRLQSELAELEQQRNRFRHELTDEQSQRGELQQAFSEQENRTSSLQNELQQAGDSLESAYRQNEEQRNEYQRLQSELAELEQQRDRFRHELTDEQSQRGELQQAFSEQENRTSSLQNELQQAGDSLESAYRQNEEQRNEYQRLQSELAELEQQRDRFRHELTDEQSQRGELQQAIADQSKCLSKLQAELGQTGDLLQATEKNKVDREQTCKRLESELSTLQADRDQLDAIRIEIREENRKLEEQLYGRDERLQEMSDALQQSLSASLDLESTADEKASACEKLITEIQHLEFGRDELLQQHEVDQKRCDELEPVLQQRDSELTRLRDQTKQSGQALQGLQQQHTDQVGLQKQLEEQIGELSLQRDQLHSDLSSQQHLLKTRERELADRDQNITALNENLQQYQQQTQELTTSVEERLNAYQSLETEKSELLTRSEQLANELQSEQWQREEMERTIAESKKNAELLKVDIQSARAELDQSTQHVAQFEQMQKSTEEELQQLRESLATKQEQLDQIDKSHLQQQADQEHLASELKAEQQASATAQQQVESLHFEMQALRDQSQVSETGENENRERLALLDAEKTSLEERIGEQDTRLEMLSAELQQAQNRCSEGESRIEELDGHYQETLQDLQAARDCLVEAQEMLQNQVIVPSEEPVEVVEAEIEATVEEKPAFVPEVVEPVEIPREEFTIAPEETSGETSSATEDLQSSDLEPNDLEPNDPESGDPEPSVPEQPSFIEQYSHMFEEEEGSGNGDISPPQPSRPVVATTPNPLLDSTGDSDEVALEAYMSNLMQRVRGEEVAEIVPAPLPQPAEPKPSQPSPVDTVSERISNVSEVSSEPEPLVPLELSDLKQSRRPETITDLTALRELANSTTRRAIASHRRKQHLEVGFGKLLACGVSAVAGTYLVLTAEGLYSASFIGGCVASFAGFYWGAQLLALVFQAIRDGSPVQKKPAEISVDAEPLPTDG